jgi:very-short-patch-repair endonuclease
MSDIAFQYEYDLEDVAKKMGVRKSNLKRTLISYGFIQNQDFTIEKAFKKRGGCSREKIELSKKCYDQLCLVHAINNRKAAEIGNIKISYIKRYLPKETEVIGFLYDILSPLFEVKQQYFVDRYFIDLYILNKKIAVECDEFDHVERDNKYESEREETIKNTLNCKIVRFNPDSPNFKLADLVSRIVRMCFEDKELA